MCEDAVRQTFKMSQGASLCFNTERPCLHSSENPVRKLFDDIFRWCPRALHFYMDWFLFSFLFSFEVNKIRFGGQVRSEGGGRMRLIYTISKHTLIYMWKKKLAITATVMTRSKVFSRAECCRVWEHRHTSTCIIDKVLMIRLMRLRA